LTLNIETVKFQLRRTVDELFAGQMKYDWTDRVKLFFPSTSANYIRSRSNAGVVGTLLDPQSEFKYLLEEERVWGGYLRYRRIPLGMDEEERQNLHDQSVQPRVEVTEQSEQQLESAWQDLMVKVYDVALEEIPIAEPVALAESLKIRVITKGPAFHQMFLRNLWQKLHRQLRNHPTFRLIGETVTEQVMLEALGIKLEGDETYLSGDYKAATDNLQSWVSEEIADRLGEVLDLLSGELRLLKESLTGHIFLNEKFEMLEQLRGQLMGSITSFPVLCIANAAMCRWAMEIAEKKIILLRDSKLLINGDDCAMRCKSTLYPIWKRITAFAGLEESVGKTYESRNFVNINSTSFERTEKPFSINCTYSDKLDNQRLTHLKLTKYVNVGLMLGMKRSGGKVGLGGQGDNCDTLGSRARELISVCPLAMQESVMKTFISHHKLAMTKSRLPWYIPEWLGGLGLPSGSWGQPSTLDLRVAASILRNWKTERPEPINKKMAQWKTWKVAQKNLPSPCFCSKKNESTIAYDNAVARECINMLFNKDVTLTDLFDVDKTDEIEKVGKAIRHNANLWNPSHHGGGKLPAPLTLEEIQFQVRYPNWTLDEPFMSKRPKIAKHSTLAVAVID
jgi:hypothetical protein